MCRLISQNIIQITCLIILIITFLSLVVYSLHAREEIKKVEDNLVSLHVIFAPVAVEFSKNIDYYEIPNKHGTLSLDGKHKVYTLGKDLKREYNNFLGENYDRHRLEAISLKGHSQEQSMQLLLAGLYPPPVFARWMNGLFWQPIPYAVTNSTDVMLKFMPDTCPQWSVETEKIIETDVFKENHNMTLRDAYNLNYYQRLGINSTQNIDRKPIIFSSNQFVKLSTFNDELKKLSTGYLLWHILRDVENSITKTTKKNIHLYSGDLYNIDFLSNVLGLNVDTKKAGSYLIAEVRKIEELYFLKWIKGNILDGTKEDIDISYCGKYCPFIFFHEWNLKYLPTKHMCHKQNK